MEHGLTGVRALLQGGAVGLQCSVVELLLIRHGQPVRIERSDGQAANPPLTELGWSQARAMADWLAHERIDALYVSPLVRAQETAVPLAERFGLRPVVVDLLAEYDRHHSHYIPLEDLKAAKAAGNGQGWADLVAGGDTEERRRWRAELVKVIEEIIASHRGQRVAAVCHGGVINAYLSHILGVASPQFFEPLYTSVTRVMAAGSGERTMVTVNESHWLRSLPQPIATAR